MPWISKSWTKEEREPYKDSTMHYHRTDVGEYMEDLVDTWHMSSGLANISLYDFLGLQEEEVNDWAGEGLVPIRIMQLWKEGKY